MGPSVVPGESFGRVFWADDVPTTGESVVFFVAQPAPTQLLFRFEDGEVDEFGGHRKDIQPVPAIFGGHDKLQRVTPL